LMTLCYREFACQPLDIMIHLPSADCYQGFTHRQLVAKKNPPMHQRDFINDSDIIRKYYRNGNGSSLPKILTVFFIQTLKNVDIKGYFIHTKPLTQYSELVIAFYLIYFTGLGRIPPINQVRIGL